MKVDPDLREEMLWSLLTSSPIKPLGRGSHVHHQIDGCTCVPGIECCRCAYEGENAIYLDVLIDIARLFTLGLPTGGLSQSILLNAPWEEIRARCHTSVSGNTLSRTVELVHKNLLVKYHAGKGVVEPSHIWSKIKKL